MGRFDTTKATINTNIKKNGNQEITGSILNSVMTEMVDATDAELTTLETILEDYVTEAELNERGFFTEEEIAALLVNKADKTYVDNAITAAITTTLNTEV